MGSQSLGRLGLGRRLLVLAAKAVLEAANRGSQALPELGKPLRSKDDQRDRQYYQPVHRRKSTFEHLFTPEERYHTAFNPACVTNRPTNAVPRMRTSLQARGAEFKVR